MCLTGTTLAGRGRPGSRLCSLSEHPEGRDGRREDMKEQVLLSKGDSIISIIDVGNKEQEKGKQIILQNRKKMFNTVFFVLLLSVKK